MKALARKKYGVLFTCLVAHAVHIEVIHSMDTYSFIHALRLFIARRGKQQKCGRILEETLLTVIVSLSKQFRAGIQINCIRIFCSRRLY